MNQVNNLHPLVLAVDDNFDNLLLLSYTLELLGFSYLCLDHGRRVVDTAKRFQPTIIILDIVMADISGIEVAKSLRAEPATAHIPLIGTTAMATQDYPSRWPIQIFDEFLIKPYLLGDLEKILSNHLGHIHRRMICAV